MKKTLLITAVVAALVSLAAYLTCVAVPLFAQQVKGSGKLITKNIPAPNFSEISASRAIKVIIADKPDGMIRIDADDNLLDMVVVKVIEDDLIITFDKSLQSISSADVTVTVPANGMIRSLEASSAAKITAEVPLSAASFEVDASSAAKIAATIEASKCEIDATSAAKIDLLLTVRDGSAEASSAAKINLKGTADHFEAEASSAGKINAAALTAKNASLEVSSGADISIHCTDILNAEASSGGSIRYSGDCTVHASKSSGGSVRKND